MEIFFVVHREPPAVTRAFHCAYQLALREEEQVPKKKQQTSKFRESDRKTLAASLT
jgi:hypothetical protein